MKIMTILGTRPEIIRLSLIIKKIDLSSAHHILVHTGQNYDQSLSDIFFDQLHVRRPDYHIHIGAQSFGQQIGRMFAEVEKIIIKENPDRILLLGDTNSALCAIIGERLGIPVYHMEAGNRCYDAMVPEETNRKIIDSISSFNLPYTPGSRENLLREGVSPQRIWVSGNPIYEVIRFYEKEIDQSDILNQLNIEAKKYILVTTHRAENVSNENRLKQIFKGLALVARQMNLPVICSIHPRTKDCLERFNIQLEDQNIILSEPFSFFDFIQLQKHALCVITDSGTVQEESCIFGIPSVTIRQSTERPETILCGSNILSGLDPNRIAECVQLMTQFHHTWECPEGYKDPLVSTKVAQFILGGLTYV